MATQPFSLVETTTTKPFTTEATEEHRELPQASTGRSACATQFSTASLLDEPWKITILPEAPKLPPGVAPQPANSGPSGGPVNLLPAPEAHAARSLPWRKGDVTRLKDDSPEGMMRYIATHATGWWQEMAERALRDTEKAERRAREAGWQPGQYWSLEVDAEAKQKLLEAEEARRQREEAAEKEAFMQRQMDLLKKAGKAPRCEYVYTDGRGCRAPQVKGERWCHGHAKMMSYRPEKLELEPMEDEQAVMVNLYRVTKSLLAGRISEKTAGLMLWSVAIGAPGAGRLPQRAQRKQRKAKNNLPPMDADERRSEKSVSRELTRMKKQKTHRGSAETWRKAKRHSPQMNAEKCRSGKKVSRESGKARGIARDPTPASQRRLAGDPGDRIVIGRDRKPKTFETQRNGVSGGKTGHSGVTARKCFRSGVDRGSTPDRRKCRHRATSPTSEKPNHKGHEGRRTHQERQTSASPRCN